jgi:WD40 repeat protein
MDMARTSGHANAITGIDWHPFEKEIVLTASLDGSVRLWNLKGKTVFYKLTCETVYSIKSARGKRTAVTSVAFHPGGRDFAVGTSCGSVQIWNATKVGPRPDRVVYDAHGDGNPISSIVYNLGGTQIATRSVEDDTAVHVWNVRKLSKAAKPVASCSNVPTIHERTSCDFSPNGKYLVVGCSDYEKNVQGQRQEIGTVKIFAISSGEKGEAIDEVLAKPGVGVVHVKWHVKLNQIFAGCSDGRYVF